MLVRVSNLGFLLDRIRLIVEFLAYDPNRSMICFRHSIHITWNYTCYLSALPILPIYSFPENNLFHYRSGQ